MAEPKTPKEQAAKPPLNKYNNNFFYKSQLLQTASVALTAAVC